MSRFRTGLGVLMLQSFLAAATTWVLIGAWAGFAEKPAGFMVPLAGGGIVLAITGALLRWSRVGGVLVTLTQLVVAFLLTLGLIAGDVANGLPTTGTLAAVGSRFADAVETAQKFAAPVPGNAPPLDPILIVAGLVFLVIVDLLGNTLRRAPLTGLPLLAIYSLPVSALSVSVPWHIFLLGVAGFLGMMFLEEATRITSWGHALDIADLDARAPDVSVRTGTNRRAALVVGVLAAGLALLLSPLIPTMSLAVFDNGRGGGGGNEVVVDNPMTDLRRDLNRPRDVPLMRMTTDNPDPEYLKISTLSEFNGETWATGQTDFQDDNAATGQLPPPVGVSLDAPSRMWDYRFSANGNFSSRWLPNPAPVEAVRAGSDWKYDLDTRDFLAVREGLTTAGRTWTARGTELDLNFDDLTDSATASRSIREPMTEVPDDLPTIVEDLAREETRNENTDYEKAVALQQFFRTPGNFDYDTQFRPGSGNEALVDFLSPTGSRSGYCEQFSAAMALMARTLDIPARVAVGFYQPDEVDANTFEYSAHDMHAWPELYFQGAGWVRFDPTPGQRVPEPPSYTQPDGADPEGSPEQPTEEPTAPTEEPTVAPTVPQDPQQQNDARNRNAGGDRSWGWIGWVLAVLVLAGAAIALPRLLRRSAAERRRRTGAPAEAAWAELRAVVQDLRLGWPEGRSPRSTGAVLAQWLGDPAAERLPRPRTGPQVNPEAMHALGRMIAAVETARYARAPHPGDGDRLREDLATVVASLRAGVPSRSRRLADWLPASLRDRSLRRTAPTTASDDDVMERVGR